MPQLGNRSSRAGLVAAVVSALIPLAVLPHVFEDLVAGTLAEFGLTPLAGGALVGAALSAQVIGAFGALRESRWGLLVVLVAALVWIGLAVYDHPGAFVPGEFRDGFTSRAAVWVLVGAQAIAGLAAFTALRSGRGSSFSGTGTYTSSGTSYGS